MNQQIRVTLNTNQDTIEQFRLIAKKLGMVSTSGPLAGEGNQNQLVEAIASGRFLVIENPVYKEADTA